MTDKQSKNRFDLEQEILECWSVVNDINTWIEQGAQADDFKILADYYERKFNRMWDTFENCVGEKTV